MSFLEAYEVVGRCQRKCGLNLFAFVMGVRMASMMTTSSGFLSKIDVDAPTFTGVGSRY